MFDVHDYYFKIPTLKERKAFRQKTQELCKVTHNNFYMWLTRHDVPVPHRKTFAEEVMQNPNLFENKKIEAC